MPECLRCGLEWQSFKERPRVCPNCKSYKWDMPPRPRGRPKKDTEKVNMGEYLKKQRDKPKRGSPKKK